jgi:hypothetical protein
MLQIAVNIGTEMSMNIRRIGLKTQIVLKET